MSKKRFRKTAVPARFNKLSAMLVAKKALRKVNKVQKAIRNEKKMHDLGVTVLVPIIAGVVSHLSAVFQGDTIITRDGNNIKAFFFELRYLVVKHATPTNTRFRISIVKDTRQVESVFPSYLDVMLSASPLSQYSRVNPGRFVVLYNKLVTLRTNFIAFTTTFTKKINIPISWVGASGADINKNGLYLLVESDAAAGQEPTFNFTWRLRFNDF